jgi:hypothetical protein
MSTLALDHPIEEETGTFRVVAATAKRWRKTIIGFAIGFPVAFYLLLLGIPILRYGHLPNYVTPYDWVANVERIIHNTNSIRDMIPIILNEWIFEIGYMDYSYGNGIAEWSMYLVPLKIVLISLTGALIGLNLGLMVSRLEATGSAIQQCARAGGSGILTSVGALFTGLTNSTLFSIACCSTPSWVGSLSILGIESSSAFALQPYGTDGTILGIVMLIISALWLAHDSGRRQTAAQPAAKGTA